MSLSIKTTASDEAREMTPPVPTFREATWLWARVGFLSFGGAAGQIAMMHRMVVDERRWVDDRTFLDALNYCTLLPGPEAQQLATYLGWRLHGIRGGIVAGAFFVVPGALLMLALSWLYVLGRDIPLMAGVFFGIKAAVLAIVAEALIRIGRRALRDAVLIVLAVTSFLALFLLAMPFPLVIVAAACVGLIRAWRGSGSLPPPSAPSLLQETSRGTRAALLTALGWLLIWWAPVALAAIIFGGGHILVETGLFFSKLAVITFGGAYAVLAYLADAAVVHKGWVNAAEMVDGLGLAETTPGPTILVNQFVGFLAGYRAPAPFSPLGMASLCALMTVWVTFAPSYVWIFAGAPFFERMRANRYVTGALASITAAVVGVIASLAVWFALNVLFAHVTTIWHGAFRLYTPDLASLRPDALALAIVAAVMLFVMHRGVVTTILVSAALGAGLTLLH
jgi:chromate transporter